jgi:hypothetical protein
LLTKSKINPRTNLFRVIKFNCTITVSMMRLWAPRNVNVNKNLILRASHIKKWVHHKSHKSNKIIARDDVEGEFEKYVSNSLLKEKPTL